MLAALESHMPDGVRWTKPEGGMFVWVELPAGLDAADLLQKSIAGVGVAFVPGGHSIPTAAATTPCASAFSCADFQKIEEGISRLGRLITETVTSTL